MLRLSLVLSCLLATAAFAGPKKKPKKAPAPTAAVAEAAIKKALDDAQPQVGGCVLEGVEPGAKTWTQVVRLKVSINGVGQVLTLDAALEPANTNAAKTKSCIEAALQKASWPTTHAPMVTVEREWTFSMQ
jgi:hypothetical protein